MTSVQIHAPTKHNIYSNKIYQDVNDTPGCKGTHNLWRLRGWKSARECMGTSRIIHPFLKYSLTRKASQWMLFWVTKTTGTSTDVKGTFLTNNPTWVMVLDGMAFEGEKMPLFFYKIWIPTAKFWATSIFCHGSRPIRHEGI